MSRDFTLGQLTEGIRDRNVGQDGGRLMNKWTRTGLLRGLTENSRENMARLLENQAAQVLREQNTLGANSGANIDGFSNIAFPIVRRVFGGLVANELVSIQPMSLPSGLLFYLDYSYGSDVGNENSDAGNTVLAGDSASFASGDSLYGQPGGRSIQEGAEARGGMYDLAGSGYSRVHKKADLVAAADTTEGDLALAYESTTADLKSVGAYNSSGVWTAQATIDVTVDKNLKLIQYDPQLVKEVTENSTAFTFLLLKAFTGTASQLLEGLLDRSMIKSAALVPSTVSDIAADGFADLGGVSDTAGDLYQGGKKLINLRRLNAVGDWDSSAEAWTFNATTGSDILLVLKGDYTGSNLATDIPDYDFIYAETDAVQAQSSGGTGSVLTIPSFESGFSSDSSGNVAPVIPEIDIKIESIAVTAQTRKLRARWSPELAQDLNAYHSLDAEVELTQILSEQIALEIDREILNDLLVEAQGANFFWSRAPGKFVNKRSGAAQSMASTLQIGPQFTGTVREWYETLVETIIDVANEIHRKTLRGAANFIVVSPEVATIFEASVLYKPSIKIDGQGQVAAPFSLGAEAIGSLSNRFTVYKDPYFPRNKILVGYKGGSYLESGYVYAPYVPLIVTPTIFAPEDFTPRKGVMTRYGKKMVRADFYGTVTCLDMDVI